MWWFDSSRGPLLVALFCLITLPGCGYHLRTMGEPEGLEIRSLAVPMVESCSSFLGFEADLTRIIRNEFISHAKVPLVSREDAAMVLIARVFEISTDPLSYKLTQDSSLGNATYEVTDTRWLRVRMAAKLVDRSTGHVIWEDRSIREKAMYTVATDPPDPLITNYNKKKAVQKIAERLAKRIYLKTMERF